MYMLIFQSNGTDMLTNSGHKFLQMLCQQDLHHQLTHGKRNMDCKKLKKLDLGFRTDHILSFFTHFCTFENASKFCSHACRLKLRPWAWHITHRLTHSLNSVGGLDARPRVTHMKGSSTKCFEHLICIMTTPLLPSDLVKSFEKKSSSTAHTTY